MKNLQHQAIKIIKKVAKQLQVEYVPQKKALTKEELLNQFNIANQFAELEIKEHLYKLAPEIVWSDAEFDMETQQKGFARDYWVCDAIDGAVHFLQGCYPWVVTLTLMRNNRPEFSIIYDYEREELFTAQRGKGAFLNDKKIEVSEKKDLASSFVSTFQRYDGIEEQELFEKTLKSIGDVTRESFALRMIGPASLQLAYIACGKIETFWEFGCDLYDWLAGSLLVEEAGGIVTDVEGKPFGIKSASGILATNNNAIQKRMIEILK